MRLYKRGEYWWCSFPWEGKTVRRSTRCTTKDAAKLVGERWERERADPDYAAAASATVRSAVDGYLTDLARTEKAAGTVRMYRVKCGVLVRIFGADRALSSVTAQLVDEYIKAREAEPVAFDAEGKPTRYVTANTIHKELVALRQVLKRARRRGEFRKDVAEVLPVGFSPRYTPRKVALTIDQAAALCGLLAPSRAAGVAFVLATTARLGEAFSARVEDVDGFVVHLRGTKTAGAERDVVVPEFARSLLAFALEHGAGKDGRVLRRWPNAYRGLRSACRRAGVPRVTWNDLRRTLSTWLLEGGASTYLVSKMLGHASTKMVEMVYGKPRTAALGRLLEEQVKALPAVQVVYASAAIPDQPQPTPAATSSQNTDENSGPRGGRTHDQGIKSPYVGIDGASEKQARFAHTAADGAGDVRVAYAWLGPAAPYVAGLMGVRS